MGDDDDSIPDGTSRKVSAVASNMEDLTSVYEADLTADQRLKLMMTAGENKEDSWVIGLT